MKEMITVKSAVSMKLTLNIVKSMMHTFVKNVTSG